MSSARDGFVEVGNYSSVGEAELARGQLAAAGISVRLDNAQTLGVLPMHSLALGGVAVVVPADAAARAREILGLGDSDEGTQEEQTEPGSAIALQGPDAWMRRAAVAAGFGSLLLPVVPTLYSLYLLARYGRGLMSARGRRHRTIAVVFNAIAVAIVTLVATTC
ncbi:MAG: hypothetical protein IPO88_01235 [Nannocystis sp.]|uniref:DUF2007 domain-containing protein n=1 Tax=Nannocystis sp. TaxID=1962667 RepID=UPI002425825B|nr:DUF2007 domain-containing protein [Nannocystis sp.]MBK9752125.1 hypothetical protein [Nannocystis sp.]